MPTPPPSLLRALAFVTAVAGCAQPAPVGVTVPLTSTAATLTVTVTAAPANAVAPATVAASAPVAPTAAAPARTASAAADAAPASGCPRSIPTMGAACKIPDPGGDAYLLGGFCQYPGGPRGCGRVCSCSQGKWTCYDGGCPELPGAPAAPPPAAPTR